MNLQLQLFVTDAAAGWNGPNDPFTVVGPIEPDTLRLDPAATIGGS